MNQLPRALVTVLGQQVPTESFVGIATAKNFLR